jgi:hypothetical protein
MDINNIFESKLFRGIILSIAGLIVLIFVFGLGVSVGTKRADFSFKWAENYHKNFAGPREGFFNDFMGKEFIDANGVFGQIIKIGEQSLTIKGRDDVEKIVLTDEKTTIRFQNVNIKFNELKVDESIIVIGEPNDKGEIEAKLIRVMPPMPLSQQTQNILN